MYTLKNAIEDTDCHQKESEFFSQINEPGVPISKALYAIAATLVEINSNLSRIADRIDEAADE
jgi:hypothetical protein